jgi:hypothetical protein
MYLYLECHHIPDIILSFVYKAKEQYWVAYLINIAYTLKKGENS